jgi:hypothetical protein
MPKAVIVTFAGTPSSFVHTKLDRAKLYGKRQRQVLDPAGERCERAELLRDGSLILRSGMTAQGFFDEGGTWVPNGDLVPLDAAGNPAPRVEPTLDVPQALEGPVSPKDVLDLAARSVYVLEPESMDVALDAALAEGKIFRFPFNLRSEHKLEVAYLVKNENGYFALVGTPAETEWSSLETSVNELDEDEGDDELDFEMF